MLAARIFGLVAAVAILAVLIGGLWPYKIWWKGLYIGQDRASAHAIFYEVTRYQSRYGGEPYYCVTSVEEWRASLPPSERERMPAPIGCVLEADIWSDSAMCDPVGRPCSESIEVTLDNDRISSIEVHWMFMP